MWNLSWIYISDYKGDNKEKRLKGDNKEKRLSSHTKHSNPFYINFYLEHWMNSFIVFILYCNFFQAPISTTVMMPPWHIPHLMKMVTRVSTPASLSLNWTRNLYKMWSVGTIHEFWWHLTKMMTNWQQNWQDFLQTNTRRQTDDNLKFYRQRFGKVKSTNNPKSVLSRPPYPPKVKNIPNESFQDYHTLPKWTLFKIYPSNRPHTSKYYPKSVLSRPLHSSKVKMLGNQSFLYHILLPKWKWLKISPFKTRTLS